VIHHTAGAGVSSPRRPPFYLEDEMSDEPKRQFVAVKFKTWDKRTYTYHNDGEPVAPGDQVKIKDRGGDGWSRVTVVEVTDEAPAFATKPILGLAPLDEPKPADGLFPDGIAEQ
jgi:hypothetical protein